MVAFLGKIDRYMVTSWSPVDIITAYDYEATHTRAAVPRQM